MNKQNAITLVMFFSVFLLFISTTSFAQKHVHGQGQLLIAQEGEQWQFEFILPAADILGFEHSPETQAQKEKLLYVINKVENVEQILRFPPHCTVISANHSLDQFANEKNSHQDNHTNEKEHHHDHVNKNTDGHKHAHTKSDAHKHEHKHEHNHGQSHEHDAHNDSHADVSLVYSVRCNRTLDSLQIPLLSWSTSLESLSAQWITNTQQGAKDLTASAYTLKFN